MAAIAFPIVPMPQRFLLPGESAGGRGRAHARNWVRERLEAGWPEHFLRRYLMQVGFKKARVSQLLQEATREQAIAILQNNQDID